MDTKRAAQLAQSASALGAGILGLGLGSKWGTVLGNYALIAIAAGAVLHVWGMYITQMKDRTERTTATAKALWVSAWICLLALVALFAFLMLRQPDR